MAIRVVQLGSSRQRGEVWLPDLAPSEELVKRALASTDERSWQRFAKQYRAEMKRPPAVRLLTLLAALSQSSVFSVGCYCEDETRCHRSILKELLAEHGARLE